MNGLLINVQIFVAIDCSTASNLRKSDTVSEAAGVYLNISLNGSNFLRADLRISYF